MAVVLEAAAEPVVALQAAPQLAPQVAPQPGVGPGLPAIAIPQEVIATLLADKETIDVNAVLDQVPGLEGGPSEGGISWHTLEYYKQCPFKFYLNKIVGLRKKVRRHALEFGSLFHAIMYMHRMTAGAQTMVPYQAVCDAGGADIAGDVWTLASVFLTKYAPQEAARWAYRALENNAVMWMPSEKIAGKQRRIPLSCRHDCVVYLKATDDEPWPGPGPLSGGLWIEDLKCLANGERLWDSQTGKRAVVETLIGGSILVPTVHKDSLEELEAVETLNSDAALFEDNGRAQVHHLQTASGREMRVTDNHPVWTDQGWVLAKDLEEGDWVCCAPLTTIRGATVLKDAEVELLGYLIGYGYLGDSKWTFTTGRENLMSRVRTLLDDLGNTYRMEESEDHTPSCVLHKGPAISLFEKAGLRGKLAPAKFIPDHVMESTVDQLKVFLAALWSTDGSIISQDRRKDLVIKYDTASSELARDVQQALWRLGIWATRAEVATVYKGEPYYFWTVTVAGRLDKVNFIEEIFPEMYHRQDKTVAWAMERIHQKRRAKDPDMLPASLVRRVADRHGIVRAGAEYIKSRTRFDGIARWVVEEMAAHREEFLPLVESPVHWDRIAANECLGPMRTTAVSVPENPSFLSEDGLITHNTAGKDRYELTRAFGMDGQFMMNAMVYRNSDEVEKFGPLEGVIVSIAFKHKRPTPEASCQRLMVPMDSDLISGFYFRDVKPAVLSLSEKLYSKNVEDPTLWPLNRCLGTCRGPYGLCEYFDICDMGNGSLTGSAAGIIGTDFSVVDSQKWTPDSMFDPPPEVKKLAGIPVEPRVEQQTVNAEKASKRKSVATFKSFIADCALKGLVSALRALPAKDGNEALPLFDSRRFLVANATEAGVKEKLESMIAQLWSDATTFPLVCVAPVSDAGAGEGEVDTELRVNFKVMKKAFQWTHEPEGGKKLKGQLGWKKVAAEMCDGWWDPARLEAEAVTE